MSSASGFGFGLIEWPKAARESNKSNNSCIRSPERTEVTRELLARATTGSAGVPAASGGRLTRTLHRPDHHWPAQHGFQQMAFGGDGLGCGAVRDVAFGG